MAEEMAAAAPVLVDVEEVMAAATPMAPSMAPWDPLGEGVAAELEEKRRKASDAAAEEQAYRRDIVARDLAEGGT